MKRYTVLFLLLIFWHFTNARNTPCQRYSKSDGLPSNTIYDVYRDSKGVLWIATDKGIARFNGTRFQVYTTSDGLPDNEVFSFTEDYEGRLWLATLNGELCYYKNDSFHNAKNTPFLKMPFKASFIKTIKVEKDSSISIVFADQIKFINVRKEKCSFFISTSPYRLQSIWYVTKQNPNLFRLEFQDKTISMDSLSRITKVNWYLSDRRKVILYCQDREYGYDSRYAYLNDRPLLQIDSLYNARIRPKDRILNRIFSDGGNTFLLTSDGLYINNSNHFFSGKALSSVTKDVFGNYWVGSLNNGLYKLPEGFLNNTVYDSVYKGELKYVTNVQNRIFFALSDKNLYQWQTGEAVKIFNSNKLKAASTAASEPFFFLSARLRYYSFYGAENVVIDNVNIKPQTPKVYKSNLLYSGFKAMYEPEDNVIYMQNHYRLHRLVYRDLKVGEDVADQQTFVSDTVFDNRIFCSAEDADHNIWYSSNRGLFKVENGRRRQISGDPFKYFVFLGRRLIGYTHDNLLLVNKSAGGVSPYFDTVHSENCIWSRFYPIDSSHLLISTNNYYRILSLAKGQPNVWIKDDPWIPLDVEGIICDATFCYFFQGGSVTSILKEQLLAKQPPPISFIAGVKSDDQQLLQSSDVAGNIIEVPYDRARNITIEFSVLSFDSKNVTYQYAISRSGRINWVDASDDQVNLINPQYGSYAIWVRAKTLSSDYCIPKMVRLRILRPFWATWWFISCVVLVIGAVIVYFVRRRISVIVKTKARENENKVRYLRSEYKALNALMNPHFIFNTLNNVQGLFNRDDKRAANEYLRIFADLVRQNMHNVSMETISLEKEMDLVKNYLLLEKLRFKQNLHYEVTIDDNVDASEITVPPLLIQPLVENAIKHGILPLESSSGIVSVDISEKDSVLQIRVADNGVGLNSDQHKKDAAHISFGLDNIRRRIEQLSAILEKKLVFEMKEEVVADQRWTVALITIPV